MVEFAERMGGIKASDIRQLLAVASKPDIISFAGGLPAPELFPVADIKAAYDAVLDEAGPTALQYGATDGWAPLRKQIAERMLAKNNVTIDPSQIILTAGSQQGLDFIGKLFLNPGDVVVLESPSYLGAINAFRQYQPNFVEVPTDGDGMIMEDLEKKILQYKPKMLYTIPTFQNPTGKTLPEERRRKVAELANRYHMVVAEDDPYRDLRYEGKPVASIKSFDTEGWVVFLGSFSKIISPGLRVGYIAGHPDLIRKCTVGKQSTDVHTANLNQAVVDLFIRRRLLPEHIRTICADYGTKMKFMLSKLSEFPGNVRYTKPQGGLFIWAELPDHLNAKALLDKAVEKKVAYVPGTHFCVNGGHENTIRLNFSNSSMEQIETGMDILKKLVAENI